VVIDLLDISIMTHRSGLFDQFTKNENENLMRAPIQFGPCSPAIVAEQFYYLPGL
jgi:hypothetical protein